MAHGFLVASRNVAVTLPRYRPTSTRDVAMPRSTPFSVHADDQCPCPCRPVRSSATALCSAARADASASVAVVTTRFIPCSDHQGSPLSAAWILPERAQEATGKLLGRKRD